MPNDQIRVIIIDDDQLVRRALVGFLKIASDIKVMATFPKAEAGIEYLRRNPVHVVLQDVHMQGIDGIRATRQIRAINPEIRVLILTSFDEHSTLHDALDAGASGFLLKCTPPEALADAIRATYRGISVISPEEMAKLRTPAPSRPADVIPDLSSREREVLRLLCRGFSNLEIARELTISESSVKTHVTALLQSLGVSSRLKAVVRAHELGFDRS